MFVPKLNWTIKNLLKEMKEFDDSINRINSVFLHRVLKVHENFTAHKGTIISCATGLSHRISGAS
jgi:hypothetical protein